MSDIVTIGVVRDFGRSLDFNPQDTAYVEKLKSFGFKRVDSLPENDKEFYVGGIHKSWLGLLKK